MLTVDGYSLVLPPCGVKSFLFSFLKAVPPNQSLVLVVPHFIGFEDIFYTKEIEIFKSHTYNSFIRIDEIKINFFLFRFLKAIGLNSDTLRRYMLFYWSFYAFPSYIKTVKSDVVFHPYQVISHYNTTAKKYVVVHDIFHWVHMERYSFIQKYFYQASAKACINSTKIITISQFSKNQIQNCLGIPSDKIVVCYEGIDDSYLEPQFNSKVKDQIKASYRLPEKYLLSFLSGRKFKKNVISSMILLHELRKRKPLIDYKLVFLGGGIESNQDVKNYLLEHHLNQDVIFIEKIDKREDLLYLYHLSAFFVFLSLEEGFGLPPLEALSCKTMPIISNNSSLGEIYGQTLPVFEPSEIGNIAQYIIDLSYDNKQNIIKNAGEILLKKYRWSTILPMYLDIINQ